MGMSHAGVQGGVEFDRQLMRDNRLAKQSAKAEDLHQASKGFWFGGMAVKPIEETSHCLGSPSRIDLDQSIKLMSNGEIGIKRKGAFKGGLCQLCRGPGPVAEFVQEPAAATEPGPRGREVRIFSKSSPIEMARDLHGL